MALLTREAPTGVNSAMNSVEVELDDLQALLQRPPSMLLWRQAMPQGMYGAQEGGASEGANETIGGAGHSEGGNNNREFQRILDLVEPAPAPDRMNTGHGTCTNPTASIQRPSLL